MVEVLLTVASLGLLAGFLKVLVDVIEECEEEEDKQMLADITFVGIIMAVIGQVLGKAHADFKHQVNEHFAEKELMITFDEEKAKDIELKTRK